MAGRQSEACCPGMEYKIAGLPFSLQPDGPAPEIWQQADGVISATAPARTDLFIDPAGKHPMSDAPRPLGGRAGEGGPTGPVPDRKRVHVHLRQHRVPARG